MIHFLKTAPVFRTNTKTYKVAHSFWRVEFQARGSPHAHLMLWLENGPDVRTEEGKREMLALAREIVQGDISTVTDDTLKHLIERCQMHKHTHTCQKKDGMSSARANALKRRMKDNKSLAENAEQDVLESEDDKLDEDKPEVRQEQTEPTRLPKGKFAERMKCRFGFPQPISEETRPRTDLDGAFLMRGDRELIIKRPDEKDRYVADYNKDILMLWQANMNIQVIFDVYQVVAYICNYVTKTDEPDYDDLQEQIVRRLKEETGNVSTKQFLWRMANAYISNQQVSKQQAIWLLMGYNLYDSSKSHTWINTQPTRYRYNRFLDVPEEKEEEETIEREDKTDGSADESGEENNVPNHARKLVRLTESVRHYEQRPTHVANIASLSQYMFFRWFNLQRKTKLKSNANEWEFKENPDWMHNIIQPPLLTVANKPRQCPELRLNNGYVIKQRKEPHFISFSALGSYTNVQTLEKLLFLFKPFTNELLLCVPENPQAETAEQRIVASFIEAIPQLEVQLPLLPEGHQEPLQSAIKYWGQLQNPLETIARQVALEQEQLEKDEEADVDWSDIIDEEINNEDYSTLSPEGLTTGQEEVYKRVDRFYLDLADFVARQRPLRPTQLLISVVGGGGTGKTYLIRLLKKRILEYHITDIGKKAVANGGVLLCATTGMAAKNIGAGAMTVHKAFAFPIEANGASTYAKLNIKQLKACRDRLQNVHTVILDEMSMLGAPPTAHAT